MPPYYDVHWLDVNGNTLDIYIHENFTPRRALVAVANRLRQSSHLVPADCMGFRLIPSEFEEKFDRQKSRKIQMDIYVEELMEK